MMNIIAVPINIFDKKSTLQFTGKTEYLEVLV